MAAAKEGRLFWNSRGALTSVRLNQFLDILNEAMHIGRYLRTIKGAPRFRSVTGVLHRSWDILLLNARGRKSMVMAGWTGKELRREPLFFVNETLLVVVVH